MLRNANGDPCEGSPERRRSKQMYKGASQNSQMRLDRGTVRDSIAVAATDKFISEKEQAVNHRRALGEIDRQLMIMPKGSPMRAALIQKKMELQKARLAQKEKVGLQYRKLDVGRVQFHFRNLVADRLGLEVSDALYKEAIAIHETELTDPSYLR